MRKSLFLLVAVTCLATLPAARTHAVSDGNYNNALQGCTGNAFNSTSPGSTEPHCYMATWQISDETHNYVTVGIPMTADGHTPSSLEVCIDLGTGTRQCALLDQSGLTPEAPTAGTPANPTSGLQFYFGMNDNIDDGEHDSSAQVDNGPSDGGGIVLNIDPSTIAQWVVAVQSRNFGYVLTHPLPVGDAGVGFCADGICFSAQTQQTTVYQGGANNDSRPVYDYSGVQWDPATCSGPTDTRTDCGGHTMAWWDKQQGTVYAEPGIQIYEDPDPQGSPVGPYPLPAFYAGTCGVVIGGGYVQMPASPYTSPAGQFIITTGCP